MPSFADDHTNRLLLSVLPPPAKKGASSATKQTLHSVLISLNPPLSAGSVQNAVTLLADYEEQRGSQFVDAHRDEEEAALRSAVLGRLVIALYGETIDTYLAEATEAENELEWWDDIERSRYNATWYLLQTLPLRLRSLALTILDTLRTFDLPLRPSVFTPTSLRHLFPSQGLLRPNVLTIALFPHLRTHPHAISLTAGIRHPSKLYSTIAAAAAFPLELTRQECSLKRKELRKLRDRRAEVLGMVAELRGALEDAVRERADAGGEERLVWFVEVLQRITREQRANTGSGVEPRDAPDLLGSLSTLATTTLPSHKNAHAAIMSTRGLWRPSRAVLLWPKLILLPPLALYAIKSAYYSRASLAEMANGALDTLDRFWHDWLLEPLKGVVNTVRAGTDEGVIVSKEGVAADIDSLERMALALAQEKLHYSQAQLQELSKQIRVGDLTPVLRIYEEDIKSPFKSAVGGTLLRSVFIQVQKAKVDIDQALAGIDKLLKSQELTFAFVGVAPAFAFVYVAGGFLRSLWTTGRGRGRYGGAHARLGAWRVMRRIERLLVSAPEGRARGPDERVHLHAPGAKPATIPPLTAGLLLLSVAHLRHFAERRLPRSSRLREGFLEDVADLEDPTLGRAEKMRVVDRMWRSWSGPLGWGTIAAEGVW